MSHLRHFDTIERAVADIRAGRMIVVVDSEDRENEGDLVMAAQAVTPFSVNFMAQKARGLICAPMTPEDVAHLRLSPQTERNTARMGTQFTVSVDLLAGTTTGISTYDRALTLTALANPQSKPEDFGRPGHIFPIRSAAGGVLERAGHTEATVEMCRLAGMRPIGVLCEILSSSGAMARGEELHAFAKEHGLSIITVDALSAYMLDRRIVSDAVSELARGTNGEVGKSVTQGLAARGWEGILDDSREVEVDFPNRYGTFRLRLFRSRLDGKDHLAIIKGAVSGGADVLTRIHSECLTGDALGSARCDCGGQLATALARIEKAGQGVVLYMRQEGRGIGLANKIRAYHLQDKGSDTVEANIKLGFDADMRDYAISAAMLRRLGIISVRLLTNNPEKVRGLTQHGIQVTGREPALAQVTRHNRKYLATKRDKLGHIFEDRDITIKKI